MPKDNIELLDTEILKVQQSTRTLFPTFTKVHNWLRMKSRIYYRWHMSPLHTAVHVFVLLAYVLNVSALSYHLLTDVRTAHANSPTIYDLADTSNFNVRFDGAAAGDNLGSKDLITGDLNGNGKTDILISAPSTDHNTLTGSGSFYLIYDIETNNYNSTGNLVDLATASNYYLRIDGPQTIPFPSPTGIGTVIIADYNGDEKDDIIISYGQTDNIGTNNGTMYLLSNELITGYSGTGNTLHISDESSYSLRIDGTAPGNLLGGWEALHSLGDLDGDGKKDLFVTVPGMDNNGSLSGSVFVISSTILDDYTGTGNSLDLRDTSKFNIRFDGEMASWTIGIGIVQAADINDNGRDDLLIGAALADPNGRANSGSTYIIYDDLLRAYSGVGNIANLASSSSYSLRIDGAVADDEFSRWSTAFGDIDNDGKLDLAAGSVNADNNARTNSGSAWILLGSLLDDYSGTGNTLDLLDSANYNLRIDGATAGDLFSYGNLIVADFNHDGDDDLLVGAHHADNNSRADSGSIYLIDNAVLRSYSGTGNLIDMADTSQYSFRWDAAAAGDRVVLGHRNMEDLNGDGIGDLKILSYFADFNSRTDSGSIYILYNFPHTIATPTVAGENTTASRTVTGSVAAVGSISNISTVQASVNTSAFAGNWTDCTPTDGAFDGKTEAYSCSLTLPSEGTHTIRIRAKDSNGVYTPASKYRSVAATYAVPTSPEPSPSISTEVSTSPAAIDTTAPALNLTAIGNTKLKKTPVYFTYISTNPRPTFSGTTEIGATVTVKAGDKELCQTTATSDTWSCTTEKLDFSEYRILITAQDVAGNETRLDAFTLKVSEPQPSPTVTTEPSTGTTATPVTEVKITNTPSPTGFIPIGDTPYTAKVRVEDEQILLSQFKVRVLDGRNQPLTNALVTLHSSPRSTITDEHGIATFGNVPTGRHTLTYSYAGATISQPINIAVADDVKASILNGEAVEITLEPAEITLPVAQFGLITAAWIVFLILTVAVAGYFGLRYSHLIFPQWSLAASKQQADLEEFEEEIHKVQQSTETTWQIFMPAHNWLRMKSRAYYWWHLLPHYRLWAILILGTYILFVAYILYRSLGVINV